MGVGSAKIFFGRNIPSGAKGFQETSPWKIRAYDRVKPNAHPKSLEESDMKKGITSGGGVQDQTSTTKREEV